MSKRLSKRQQRELEELEMLKAAEKQVPEVEEAATGEEEEEGEAKVAGGLANAFAALGPEDIEEPEEDEEGEEAARFTGPKKSKKKKNKKKRPSAPVLEDDAASEADSGPRTPAKGGKSKKKTPLEPANEMDEVDRALAELRLKYGEDKSTADRPTSNKAESSSVAGSTLRKVLGVDPKNLDADAELRRFFGSKVIAADKPSTRRVARGYTLAKPKANYPPPTSLAGLTMRELNNAEKEEFWDRRPYGPGLDDRWFTFEHSVAWKEVTRQFLGAVRSHDPNELMALLQVYPWHVDTLLQMSEVYRLQSDIGAASDYAERALYALDRCLHPNFNVTSGLCRLDFDRVENRPLFVALHRIISYLGRRGCWNTAFNFGKLLFALDPIGDPHSVALWLDFLAIKSGNGSWIMSMMEERTGWHAASMFTAYPGMAYALALAQRAKEKEETADSSKSDEDLREAMTTFPQVIIPLADKIGATLPDSARNEPLLAVQAGYTDEGGWSNVQHLLAHIYVSRSEALWKDPSNLAWFESQLPLALEVLHDPVAAQNRQDAQTMWTRQLDPIDVELVFPLAICRHVVCSESTSFLGFLPPRIRKMSVNAFDPLPPSTAISIYDDEYFSGLGTSERGGRVRGGAGGVGGGRGGMMGLADGFMERLMEAINTHPADWQARVREAFGELLGAREYAGIPEEQRENLMRQFIDIAENTVGEEGAGDGRMPGGFPNAEDERDGAEQ